MKVLVVGSGAREHTIAWKLSTSPRVSQIFTAPGNAGTQELGANLPIAAEDIDTLALAATRYGVDLTVVGPEYPLAYGIVDRFQNAGLKVFGPTKSAARIEISKAFARELMREHNVPSPDFRVFHSYAEGYQFLSQHQGPVVVKADGLAAGKGAFVCRDQEAAINALYDCMQDRIFGAAGSTVVVEECLEGQEISVFAFADGERVSSLAAACDYKRLLDGDKGLNTGGMGCYAPANLWTPERERQVRQEIMEPVVRAMAQEGAPYKGVLYAGLMLTPSGPKVLEFNCRLGDPETQVLLPSVKTDLADAILATIDGNLENTVIDWGDTACVGVVMASRGYPGEYRRGLEVQGLNTLDEEALPFHAGTARTPGKDPRIITTGGRVLTIVGFGSSVSEARTHAYENVSRVDFQGCHYRKDIGLVQRVAARREETA